MINKVLQSYAMQVCVACLLFTVSFGCVKRTLSITTTPPSALVWLNDREVGRTPLDVDFLYYGEYDVRIQHDDTESVMTTRWLRAPWWDTPFVDIGAEILPFQLDSTPSWHFDLTPRNDNVEELVDRATRFRFKESGVEE